METIEGRPTPPHISGPQTLSPLTGPHHLDTMTGAHTNLEPIAGAQPTPPHTSGPPTPQEQVPDSFSGNCEIENENVSPGSKKFEDFENDIVSTSNMPDNFPQSPGKNCVKSRSPETTECTSSVENVECSNSVDIQMEPSGSEANVDNRLNDNKISPDNLDEKNSRLNSDLEERSHLEDNHLEQNFKLNSNPTPPESKISDSTENVKNLGDLRDSLSNSENSSRQSTFSNERESALSNERESAFSNERESTFSNERESTFSNERESTFSIERESTHSNERESSVSEDVPDGFQQRCGIQSMETPDRFNRGDTPDCVRRAGTPDGFQHHLGQTPENIQQEMRQHFLNQQQHFQMLNSFQNSFRGHHLEPHFRDEGPVSENFEHFGPGDMRNSDERSHLHPYRNQMCERSQQEEMWNMQREMFSKMKSETKEWFDKESSIPDGNSSLLKSRESLDSGNSFRMTPMDSESPGSGPRPSPLPNMHPYSVSPDIKPQVHPQHFHQFQNHPGLRDMPPVFREMHPGFRDMHSDIRDLPPGYHSHPRLIQSPLHGASQLSGSDGMQSPNHLHQQYGPQGPHQPQFGSPGPHQNQMLMPGHPGHLHGQQLQSFPPGMLGHHLHDGREGEPYGFIDEYSGHPTRPTDEILGHCHPKRRGRKPKHIKLMENGGDPMAIAAAQAAHEAKIKRKWRPMGPDGKILHVPESPVKPPRRPYDRFEGTPEEEISRKILPDQLRPNLDIVIVSKFPFQIGGNPGLFSAFKGHHYAGPGNHFWKCLYLSGLIPEPLTSDDDHQLLNYGIGFTNIVSRTTRGSSELTRKEIKEGGQLLLAKLQRFQPRIAVFNGKGIYEVFSGKKEFLFGRQPERIENTRTHVWVMPSSSARCAQLPRALDKVPFYTALRKFRDFLSGVIMELTPQEITSATQRNPKLLLKDCDNKLTDMCLDDGIASPLASPFIDDVFREDLEAGRFEGAGDPGEMDSVEEISKSITQSLYNLSGISLEQLENMEFPTIPVRKKRGRPKKCLEHETNMILGNTKPRDFTTELFMCNGEEPPRKKRGRPKKILEDGSLMPCKKAGRKPKVIKDMLLQSEMGECLGNAQIPENGMMSPAGFPGDGIPPYSPQFGSSQMHEHSELVQQQHEHMHNLNHAVGRNFQGPPNPIGPNNFNPGGCPTPTSTPQTFSQSPAYSPAQRCGTTFPHTENSKMSESDGHIGGLSPLPNSPVITQPDFEPPSSLPDNEGLINDGMPIGTTGAMPEETPIPSIQSQFSDSSMVPEESGPRSTFTQNFPNSYPTSTTSNLGASPSYSSSVSCSPSYPPNQNTQSPNFNPTNQNTHSPNFNPQPFPNNSGQSPSYPHQMSQSPSYPSISIHQSQASPTYSNSPTYTSIPPSCNSFAPNNTQNTKSSAYSTLNASPSYISSMNQSPGYIPNSTQSPFPPTSHSPSFPTLAQNNQSPFGARVVQQSPSPAINSLPTNLPTKPLISPQVKNDMASKSLSGLESLVDQIPNLNDGEGVVAPLMTNGPLSNPTTPVSSNDPFSPGNCPTNSAFTNYGPPGSQFSRFSASQNPTNSSNFSVANLTSNTFEPVTSSPAGSASTGVSMGMSQLARGTPTPTNTMYSNSYSPAPPGPTHPYGSPVIQPGSPMGPSYMSSNMGPIHPSMGVPASQIPYPYSQYSEGGAPIGYSATGHPSFPYSANPGFHVGGARFAYPAYSTGPYPQGYPQSAMIERIKQSGMGMGFGGF